MTKFIPSKELAKIIYHKPGMKEYFLYGMLCELKGKDCGIIGTEEEITDYEIFEEATSFEKWYKGFLEIYFNEFNNVIDGAVTMLEAFDETNREFYSFKEVSEEIYLLIINDSTVTDEQIEEARRFTRKLFQEMYDHISKHGDIKECGTTVTIKDGSIIFYNSSLN